MAKYRQSRKRPPVPRGRRDFFVKLAQLGLGIVSALGTWWPHLWPTRTPIATAPTPTAAPQNIPITPPSGALTLTDYASVVVEEKVAIQVG